MDKSVHSHSWVDAVFAVIGEQLKVEVTVR